MTGRVASVVVAGLAGQRVVETARLLAEAALRAGLDASFSEFPSPLACGGPVSAHVRMGDEVCSPVVSEGGADVLLGLEELEAARAARLLARGGFAAVSRRMVPTWRMRAALEPAPDALARLEAVTPRVVSVPIESPAQPPGQDAGEGMVLLGLASALLPPPREAYADALHACAPPDLDARWQAFERGRELFARLPQRLASAAIDPLDIARARR